MGTARRVCGWLAVLHLHIDVCVMERGCPHPWRENQDLLGRIWVFEVHGSVSALGQVATVLADRGRAQAP